MVFTIGRPVFLNAFNEIACADAVPTNKHQFRPIWVSLSRALLLFGLERYEGKFVTFSRVADKRQWFIVIPV